MKTPSPGTLSVLLDQHEDPSVAIYCEEDDRKMNATNTTQRHPEHRVDRMSFVFVAW
jgi:hypothetical protein